MNGKFPRSISVGLARRARLAGKGVEQRRTLFHAGHHHTALGTHEHVTGSLIGTDTVGQARYVLGRKRQRESPTSFGFGSMGLIHHHLLRDRRTANYGWLPRYRPPRRGGANRAQSMKYRNKDTYAVDNRSPSW